MCWNWEVSIIWSLGLAIGSIYLLKRSRFNFRSSVRDKWSWIVIFNLACVQFWEFLIWLTVQPIDSDLNKCPKSNIAFTAMVYFHGVIFWPPLVNTFAIKTTSGVKSVFAFPLIYGCLYTLLGLADFFYAEFQLDIPTCGTDGKTFLRWNVALTQNRILPNGFDWFLFTAFPLLFYKPAPLGWIMCFYLILTFAIPYVIVATLGEAASMFCWLGFGFFLIFLFDPYVVFLIDRYFPSLNHFADPIIKRLEVITSLWSDEKVIEEVKVPELELKETKEKYKEVRESGGSVN